MTKYGLTVAQDKQAEFDKEFAANYKSVAEVAKIEAARDNFKSQLDTAQASLKSFEGVDVNELKKQIGDHYAKQQPFFEAAVLVLLWLNRERTIDL